MSAAAEPRVRVDKWLWHARFCKTRGLASDLVASGKLRINGVHCTKAAAQVGPGDVLTFPKGRDVRVIRIEAIGMRRGPAPEARALYTDLAPPAQTSEPPSLAGDPQREPGSGRPTKKARREIDALRRVEP